MSVGLTISVVSSIPKGMSIKTATKVAAAVVAATAAIEARAKARAPWRTGYLRGSIQGRSTGMFSGEVGVGAEYGVYVEFGTSKMGAQPYLTPAVEEVAPIFSNAIKAALP